MLEAVWAYMFCTISIAPCECDSLHHFFPFPAHTFHFFSINGQVNMILSDQVSMILSVQVRTHMFGIVLISEFSEYFTKIDILVRHGSLYYRCGIRFDILSRLSMATIYTHISHQTQTQIQRI